jgi:hypothetical protein
VDTGSADQVAFQLNRIRYASVLYLSHPDGRKTQEYVTGELLDVSHAIDTDSKRMCTVCRAEKPWSHIPSSIRFFPQVRFSILSPHEQYLDHFFMLFKQSAFPWLLPKYAKRVRRLSSVLVMFLFSRRSLRQYAHTQWSRTTIVERIDMLQALVRWFRQALETSMGGTLPEPPSYLHGAPLVRGLIASIFQLWERILADGFVQFVRLVDSMLQVFVFFHTVFVREKFYAQNPAMSHTRHSPGILFDQVPMP